MQRLYRGINYIQLKILTSSWQCTWTRPSGASGRTPLQRRAWPSPPAGSSSLSAPLLAPHGSPHLRSCKYNKIYFTGWNAEFSWKHYMLNFELTTEGVWKTGRRVTDDKRCGIDVRGFKVDVRRCVVYGERQKVCENNRRHVIDDRKKIINDKKCGVGDRRLR